MLTIWWFVSTILTVSLSNILEGCYEQYSYEGLYWHEVPRNLIENLVLYPRIFYEENDSKIYKIIQFLIGAIITYPFMLTIGIIRELFQLLRDVDYISRKGNDRK